MNTQVKALVFTLMVLVISLQGCSSETGPETTYWQYWKACSEGKFDKTKQFIAENVKPPAGALGSCGFTHDAINTIEASSGKPLRTFPHDPEVLIDERATSLTWIDDQGNITNVVLVYVEGKWKVTNTYWSP